MDGRVQDSALDPRQAFVNRLWNRSFGRGLVMPLDQMHAANPPSHPELLDELTRQLVCHQFDLKFLIRAMTASKTYQLSSRVTQPGQQPGHEPAG